MDGPRGCHTEQNTSDREGEISYAISYIQDLKRNNANELTEQKETHWVREWVNGCWGKGREEETVREFGMDMYTLLYLKMDNLQYTTGNST